MVTKHFFKVLIIFSIMIAIGMVGVFMAEYFNKVNDTKAMKLPGVAN